MTRLVVWQCIVRKCGDGLEVKRREGGARGGVGECIGFEFLF